MPYKNAAVLDGNRWCKVEECRTRQEGVSRWRAVSHTSKIHAEPPQAVQTKVIKARRMSSCHLEEGRHTFRADFNFYS